MYLDYWGFAIFPFENVPDPDFFYPSKGHEEALTRLSYAVKMRKGGAMLSGEIGCGKTTLTRVYIEELTRERYDIGLVINPCLGPKEFLQEILYQFGIVDAPDTKVQCLRVLNEKIMVNMKENTETLLIVDEAQLLNRETFEEIRLLLNFQLNDRFLLSVILVGQPELKGKVRNIKQLEQRIAIKYHITPFDLKDTARYIVFRQKKAGKNGNVFSREAIERIHESSGGVPRKINNLCDLSLLLGFSESKKVINSKLVESIIQDGALF